MELVTRRLYLREFRQSDFSAVYSYESDPEVTQYVSYGPYTQEECQRDLAFHIAHQEAEPRVFFHLAITLHASPHVIGWCGVEVDADRQEAELGYALHRHYWGQGYVTEAAQAMVAYSFNHLQVRRLFATCRPENIGSMRVLQKLGMHQEEYLREHKWFKGRWWDTLVYSISAQEWHNQ